jgi:hypothetical protein
MNATGLDRQEIGMSVAETIDGPPRSARRSRRGLLLLALALVVAVGLGVWWWFFGGAELPVTQAEARRYLDRIVAAAQRQDWDAMCALNGAPYNCRVQLEQVGTDSVPTDPPTIVSNRYSPKKGRDDTAGRILVVVGTDGKGRPYRTEVMVFRENRYHFKAINAVYWSNYKVIEPGPDGGYETHPGG